MCEKSGLGHRRVPALFLMSFSTSINILDARCGTRRRLDTLRFSGSATPVPDVVALAATAQNDGILHITGTSGPNAFAVAAVPSPAPN
jgi:hypothetical protein